MNAMQTIEPITDQDVADLAMSIIEDAASRLRMLNMSSLQVAHVFTEAGIIGIMAHGGYDPVITAVSATVAAYQRRAGGTTAH